MKGRKSHLEATQSRSFVALLGIFVKHAAYSESLYRLYKDTKGYTARHYRKLKHLLFELLGRISSPPPPLSSPCTVKYKKGSSSLHHFLHVAFYLIWVTVTY